MGSGRTPLRGHGLSLGKLQERCLSTPHSRTGTRSRSFHAPAPGYLDYFEDRKPIPSDQFISERLQDSPRCPQIQIHLRILSSTFARTKALVFGTKNPGDKVTQRMKACFCSKSIKGHPSLEPRKISLRQLLHTRQTICDTCTQLIRLPQ